MDPRTSPVKSSQKRPYAEVIEERFPPFDAQSVVAEPYNNELKRDAEFQASQFTYFLFNIASSACAYTRIFYRFPVQSYPNLKIAE